MKKITILIVLLCLIILYAQSATRFWVGSSGNFDDGTHWSYSSGGSPIGGTINWANTDIAIFDANSGSPTVTVTSSENIGKLQISGSIVVTFKPPTGGNRSLTINTIASDALTVAYNSTLIVSGQNNGTLDRDMTVQLDTDYGIIGSINGTVKVIHDDEGIGKFQKSGSSALNFNSGSLYQHDVNADALPVGTWNANSTCLITGVTDNIPSNTDQTFGNFTWNCSGQTQELNFAGNFYDVNGNLSILSTNNYILRLSITTTTNMVVDGNYSQSGNSIFALAGSSNNTMTVNGNFTLTGGSFYLCTSNANPTLNIKGNFNMTGAANSFTSYLGSSNYSTVNFNGTGVQSFTKSSGVMYYRIYFYVRSGATLDLGSSILGDYLYTNGTFTLESGASLRTAHAQGIVNSGDAGCIRVSGTRSYSSGANFAFYGSGAQASGNGLSTSLSGILTIGSTTNATTLTLTNGSAAISNKLILVSNTSTNSSISSGTISYGSSGTLEYQGGSVQTTTNVEYPVHPNGPPNLIINNSQNVLLNNSKCVKNDLTLTSGNLAINGNTLTLQRYIIKTGGGLSGGTSSNIIIEGGAFSTSLPGVTNGLANLTVNRASATISLTGAIDITGTMTMTAGSFTLSGGVLSYGSAGVLNYNGAVSQTTSSAEFPASGGPFTLEINSSSTVNLHASSTLGGPLNLLSGIFSIGANTLTLNNIIYSAAGSMTGGSSSNIIFGDYASTTTLPGIILGDLTISRGAGISLGGNVTVSSNLYLNSGYLLIGANTLTVNGQISYFFGSVTGGITSSMIFGGSGLTTHIPALTLSQLEINRAGGTIMMDNDLTVMTHLGLNNGSLSIGSNLLTINGYVSQTFGSLSGGTTSDITFSGENPSTYLPAVTLNNLTIDRASGVEMSGNVNINGNLYLNTGMLDVGSFQLSLNGEELTVHPEFLILGPNSSLSFGGTVNQVDIPATVTELNNLTIVNPNEVILTSNVVIYGGLTVSGFFNAGSFQVTGPGNFILMPSATLYSGNPDGITGFMQLNGIQTFNSTATFGFNGNTDQVANFPELTTPETVKTLVVTNVAGSAVHLNSHLKITTLLEIKSVSTLEILPNVALTSQGIAQLSGAECLRIKADASGAGSFIDNGIQYIGEGSAAAERYISQNRWHYISSPVTNAVSGVFLDLYLKWFSEPDSLWNYIIPVDFPLNVGRGFACWSQPWIGEEIRTYTGMFNTGDIPIPMTATDRNGGGIGEWEGWNLIGNPYPSAIDWNLIPPEFMINIEPTVYVWNGSQYLCYPYDLEFGQLTDGIIPAQQAFFIKATDFDPQLTLTQESRVHGFSPYKSKKEVSKLLDIEVTGNNYRDELFIHLSPDATPGFDAGMDAYKLMGIEEAPQLYVLREGLNLSICVLPVPQEEIILPLGFRATVEADYTFNFSGFETFDSPDNIYFEDIKENEMIRIADIPVFTIEAGPLDENHRFNILINHIAGIGEPVEFKPFIYFSDNAIHTVINENVSGLINIASLSGQKIDSKAFGKSGMYSFNVAGKQGCFLVEVIADNKRYCTKVLVQ